MKKFALFSLVSILSSLVCSCSPASNNEQNYTYQELINVEGAKIETTIDPSIQNALDSLLKERIIELYAKSGHAAVLETKTGKILALSNWDREGDSCYVSISNHLIEDRLDPGSMFSVFSYMSLLEDGKLSASTEIDTENTPDKPASWSYEGLDIRDDFPVGIVSMEEAIVQSSNIAIAKSVVSAYDVDHSSYLNNLREFGIYDNLELDKDFETFQPNEILSGDTISKASLAQMSYGYEQQLSPISILAVYNAIANDGKLMRPYRISSVEKDGTILYRQQPKVIRDSICSKETLDAVKEALEGVTERGTAHTIYTDERNIIREGAWSKSVKIAGKTGVARIYEDSTYAGNGHWVSFVGYFPADDPQYTVMVQLCAKPGGNFGRPGGGYMAGAVVRKLAEWIYR